MRGMRKIVCFICACVLAAIKASSDSDSDIRLCGPDCPAGDFVNISGNGVTLPDEELRQLMIEHIKTQILHKLRLTAPPHVTKPVIPHVLVLKHLLEDAEEHPGEVTFAVDDFYGRAEEIVIFPENTSTHNCYSRDDSHPNSCFLFRLTSDVTSRSVRTAELWVYAVDNSSYTSNNTYTVSEMIPDPRGDGHSFLERVVATVGTPSSGWVKFELGPAVRTWCHRHHLTHAIQISCIGCDSNLEYPVSVEDGNKPFILVHTNPWQRTQRSKRSLTCHSDTSTCCKENFRLYFKDIGWHNWIVQPEFYEANFCRGSCITDTSPTRYHHTTIIRRYIQTRGEDNSSVSLCCVASQLESLTIVYVEKNLKLVKSILPNMVVKSCDCV